MGVAQKFILVLFIICTAFTYEKKKIVFYPPLGIYTQTVMKEFSNISDARKVQLKKIALFTETKIKSGEEASLLFICTHNSRRSHLSQIWAQVAANYYELKNVKTYSGGTEATAFNPKAVDALKRAGFKITKTSEDGNPIYKVKYNDTDTALYAFSKKYDDVSNPQTNFCAIMTCSQADKTCPLISGQSMRIALPYEDPKVFDGTPDESRMYDIRCKQIAIEMFYVFSIVNK